MRKYVKIVLTHSHDFSVYFYKDTIENSQEKSENARLHMITKYFYCVALIKLYYFWERTAYNLKIASCCWKKFKLIFIMFLLSIN